MFRRDTDVTDCTYSLVRYVVVSVCFSCAPLRVVWLANMTMPWLAYAASQLARFLTNPGPSHYAAALRVLLYHQVTKYTLS